MRDDEHAARVRRMREALGDDPDPETYGLGLVLGADGVTVTSTEGADEWLMTERATFLPPPTDEENEQ